VAAFGAQTRNVHPPSCRSAPIPWKLLGVGMMCTVRRGPAPRAGSSAKCIDRVEQVTDPRVACGVSDRDRKVHLTAVISPELSDEEPPSDGPSCTGRMICIRCGAPAGDELASAELAHRLREQLVLLARSGATQARKNTKGFASASPRMSPRRSVGRWQGRSRGAVGWRPFGLSLIQSRHGVLLASPTRWVHRLYVGRTVKPRKPTLGRTISSIASWGRDERATKEADAL